MGIELTKSQREALESLRTGPAAMAIVHFGKLRDLGLVEKTGGSSGRRGYTVACLTDAGTDLIA